MSKQRIAIYFGIFITTLLLGMYFRTYDLRLYLHATEQEIVAEAEERVRRFIDKQLVPQIEEQFPNLSGKELESKIEEARQGLKQRDWNKYHDRLTRTISTMPKSAAISRIILLGADSYHYFDLMQRIHKNGTISDQIEKGRYYHEGRHFPFGIWSVMTWHPHMGHYWYLITKMFVPQIDLMEAAALYPIFMYVMILMTFLFFAIYLRGSPMGIFLGCIALATSPLFMQRTMFGWFDTDPYSFLFVYLVLGLTFAGVKAKRKHAFILGGLAGFFTLLFSFFWTGWPFLAVIVLGTCTLGWIISRFRDEEQMSQVIPFLGAFVGAFIIMKLIHMGPYHFYSMVMGVIKGLFLFSSRAIEGWPDMFIIVRETQAVSFHKIIEHASNNWMVGVALIGMISYAKKAWDEDAEHGWAPWIAMMIAFWGSFYLSLKTERFALLCVIPLAVLVMWGIEGVQGLLTRFWKKAGRSWLAPTISWVLIMCLLPINIHAAAHRLEITDLRFFDNAWFKVMGDVQKGTAKDANILSWWPSGYFISAVGQRTVFTDGGSQHFPEAYWSARFYFATNELEALGIVRMLNSGGNSAVKFLMEDKGMRLDHAISLIDKLLPISREEAITKLPKDWTDQDKNKFLSLTHGEKMPQSIAMAYQDVVRKVSSLSIIARWDFKKAVEWKDKGKGREYKELPPSDPYLVAKSLPFPSSIFRSEEPADVIRQDGDMFYFRNGIQWNRKTLETFYVNPRVPEQQAPPTYLYYMKDGQLLEKVWGTGRRISMATLIYEDNGKWYSVIAAPQLIRSMLYRMYYLKGAGLKYFKPFSRDRNPVTGHWVLSFELDWDKANIS